MNIENTATNTTERRAIDTADLPAKMTKRANAAKSGSTLLSVERAISAAIKTKKENLACTLRRFFDSEQKQENHTGTDNGTRPCRYQWI